MENFDRNKIQQMPEREFRLLVVGILENVIKFMELHSLTIEERKEFIEARKRSEAAKKGWQTRRKK